MSVRRQTVTAAAVLCALASGCTKSPGAVDLAAPTPAGSVAGTCAALVAALSHDLGGRRLRAVSPASPYSAAWGDPAITLRCGTPPHVPTSADSEVDIAGLTWRVRTVGDYVLWDAVDRVTGVEVRVPLSEQAQEGPMSDIGAAVGTAIPAAPSASPSRTGTASP